MVPKHEINDDGNSHVPKKRHKVLLLSKKKKILNLSLLRSTIRINFLFVKLWKTKNEIGTSFAVVPQTEKTVVSE